ERSRWNRNSRVLPPRCREYGSPRVSARSQKIYRSRYIGPPNFRPPPRGRAGLQPRNTARERPLRRGVRVIHMGWPDDWDARVDGSGCAMCAGKRYGALIGETEVSKVWFPRAALVRGYAIVAWRGRHVVEPHHLSDDEANRYFGDVLRVGRAIEECFGPL